eukprot:m.13415 g.13415  ORF g.13415 m.13415 type:complete len:202 (+) comp6866_c0_seq1:155-760(+)
MAMFLSYVMSRDGTGVVQLASQCNEADAMPPIKAVAEKSEGKSNKPSRKPSARRTASKIKDVRPATALPLVKIPTEEEPEQKKSTLFRSLPLRPEVANQLTMEAKEEYFAMQRAVNTKVVSEAENHLQKQIRNKELRSALLLQAEHQRQRAAKRPATCPAGAAAAAKSTSSSMDGKRKSACATPVAGSRKSSKQDGLHLPP